MVTYRVQVEDDEVAEVDEEKLRKLLRKRELSGLELVRRDDDDDWHPLHELALFKEEVPFVGDPRDAARRNVARGLGWHALSFTAVIGGITVMTGVFPFWAAFWGIGLAAHAAKAVGPTVELFREGKLFGAQGRTALPAHAAPKSAEQESVVLDEVEQEAERVRVLLAEQDMALAEELSVEVAAIADCVRAIRAKEADLEEQTSDTVKTALIREMEGAQMQLDRAGGEDLVFTRQIEALQARLRAIDEATTARARLLARRSVALNQLKKLRLDLSSAGANKLAPDLPDRLAEIRLQVEASRETNAALAASDAAGSGGAGANAEQDHEQEQSEVAVPVGSSR